MHIFLTNIPDVFVSNREKWIISKRAKVCPETHSEIICRLSVFFKKRNMMMYIRQSGFSVCLYYLRTQKNGEWINRSFAPVSANSRWNYWFQTVWKYGSKQFGPNFISGRPHIRRHNDSYDSRSPEYCSSRSKIAFAVHNRWKLAHSLKHA